MQPVCDMGGDSAQAIGRASRPSTDKLGTRPPLGCWEFPLSRAEKVHLLLDLYSMEVQACHLEVAKLKASDRSSSSGCSRTSASSGHLRPGGAEAPCGREAASAVGRPDHRRLPRLRRAAVFGHQLQGLQGRLLQRRLPDGQLPATPSRMRLRKGLRPAWSIVV
ncbi:unnamed protein product [Effrenium voratum]|nr:unnamed protein product [Effrenium voratum]